ncbi:MAG: hypothetical protein J0I06_11695 [Planctomycetes bacterium]|nr:hypothetical protein [Planctomycetota bacterium]
MKLALPVAAVALVSGCGDSGELTGTVRYRDRPLSFGTVQVRGSDGVIRTGPIAADGTYTIAGLPSGATAVSVTCRDPRELEQRRPKRTSGKGGPEGRIAQQPAGAAGGAGRTDFSLIPVVYSDLDRSGLGTTLRSGVNRYDVDLK